MRVYSAVFAGVSVSVAQDLLEINAPSTGVVRILEVHISDDTSETSEQLPFQMHRASTSGSGGTAPTARPLDDGYGAFGGTVEVNNTTRGTAGNILRRRSENMLNGLHWIFADEKERPVISPSGRLIVGLETAPAAARTMSGEIVFEVIGG